MPSQKLLRLISRILSIVSLLIFLSMFAIFSWLNSIWEDPKADKFFDLELIPPPYFLIVPTFFIFLISIANYFLFVNNRYRTIIFIGVISLIVLIFKIFPYSYFYLVTNALRIS